VISFTSFRRSSPSFSKRAFYFFLNFTDIFYRFFSCWHSEGEGHNENCHYRVLKIEVTQLLPPALDSSRRVVSGGIRPESVKFSCLRRILRPGSFSTNIITSVFVLLTRITGILKRSVPLPGRGPSGILAINAVLVRKVPNTVREWLKRGISINLDFSPDLQSLILASRSASSDSDWGSPIESSWVKGRGASRASHLVNRSSHSRPNGRQSDRSSREWPKAVPPSSQW